LPGRDPWLRRPEPQTPAQSGKRRRDRGRGRESARFFRAVPGRAVKRWGRLRDPPSFRAIRVTPSPCAPCPPRSHRMTPFGTFVEIFLQALLAGILIGAIYGLMCVGLGIIFGVMRVINFAQGEFLMLGMYFTFYLVVGYDLMWFLGPSVGPYVGALIAGPVLFVFGYLLHRFLISRVTG